MPRPRRCRWVRYRPEVDFFKPRGVPINALNTVTLNVEELEAIRLKDVEVKDQHGAAKEMKVSQSTFHRILQEARKKVATALVEGKAIKIQGGVFTMPSGDGTGPIGQGRGMGRGRGRMGGQFAAGVGGVCKCPKCGHEQSHAIGQPCNKTNCPKCGTLMTRSV